MQKVKFALSPRLIFSCFCQKQPRERKNVKNTESRFSNKKYQKRLFRGEKEQKKLKKHQKQQTSNTKLKRSLE